MKYLLNQFKVNRIPKLSDSLEILFDFVVVALVSLIFNGFIINSHNSDFDQKYLMVANAMLLSTHWYAYNFFRQRYEKKNIFFRVWMLINVLALAIMATGIDLMVFRLNVAANKDPKFLRWFSAIILLFGFILSRLSMALQFTFGAIANKDNPSIWKLTVCKYMSRYIVAALAIVQAILIGVFPHHPNTIALSIYISFPVYLLVEFLGNVIHITDKNLRKAPKVSIAYAKERLTKLDILYISSFFVSGTIQFAFYFKEPGDLYMLPRLLMVYIVGFLIWWAYMDRVRRFQIKQTASNLILGAAINVITTGSLAVFGGMLINASNDGLIDVIMPSVFIAAAIYLSTLAAFTPAFEKGPTEYEISNDMKMSFAKQTVPAVVLLITFGIVSMWFAKDLTMWAMYGVVIFAFVSLNIGSRYIITKYKKSAIAQ